MFSHEPTREYNGLSIILSCPSRFDLINKRLLTGNAGNWFLNDCLRGIDIESIFIADIYENKEIYLPNGTRSAILLGRAARDWMWGEDMQGYNINSWRGICRVIRDISSISSYIPQETFDPMPFEEQKNPCYKSRTKDNEEISETSKQGEEDEEEGSAEKDLAPTRHENRRFWLKADTQKLLNIHFFGLPNEPSPNYILRPTIESVLQDVRRTDGPLFIDLETDLSHNLTVIGIGLSNYNIYSLPISLHDCSLAYPIRDLVGLFRELDKQFRSNREIVVHNAGFDIAILSSKYSLPIPSVVYDTMIAQHRIYPEAEKSLGHCMSMYLNMPFHKDEGVFNPKSYSQVQQLLAYNAKDVFATALIYKKQKEYASLNEGLKASIAQANSSIPAYISNSLLGIRIDSAERDILCSNNLELLKQYQQCINYLVGDSSLLPSSSKSCVNYFHTRLGYGIVARSEKTNVPSLDSKSLLKLKLKNPNNIVIDFVLAYRARLKENSIKDTVLWTPPSLKKTQCYSDKSTSVSIRSLMSSPLVQSKQPAIQTQQVEQQQEQLSQSKNPTQSSTESSSNGLEGDHSKSTKISLIDPLNVRDSSQRWKNSSTQQELQSVDPNRITCQWKISGTKTFRLSSSKFLGRYGTNLQNTSEGQLKIFIPDDGKIFVQGDQAGAEALVVSYLCSDGKFRELFKNGIKSHNYVGLFLSTEAISKDIPEVKEWLSLPISDLRLQYRWSDFLKWSKSHGDLYYIWKKTCHSGNYGIGPRTFINAVLSDSGGKIVLTPKEASRFLGVYHGLFPEILQWHEDIKSEVKTTNTLHNLFNYPRHFGQRIDESNIKEAYAFIPQSTVGTITNIAFTGLSYCTRDVQPDWDVLNNKHDSILLQVPIGHQEAAKEVLRGFLGKELTSHRGEKFTMGVEVKAGYNWGDYDKDANPKGLKEI